MKPVKVEFDIGQTIHKQSVKMIYERDSMNRMSWTIIRCAADQRDDTDTIRGLPSDVIKEMAEAVKLYEARGLG